MNPGERRNRVALLRATESQDASGGPLLTWSRIGRRWARIEWQSGRQFFEASHVVSERVGRFFLPCDALTKTLHPRDRIEYDGTEYDIVSVINPQERNRAVMVTAAAVE